MIAIFLLLLLLPFSYMSMTDASQTMKREIYDFARGSYDILLRPPDSRIPIEEKLGLVEENYLGIGDGGITLEQWQSVLQREDVEVAAPVAAVGLFTAPEITYQLPERKQPLRYEVVAMTTDGVEEYVMGPPVVAYSIPHEAGYEGYAVFVEDSLVNVFMGKYPSFKLPPSYHQVVAIDVEQEQALTGIDFTQLDYREEGFGPEDFLEIPILSLENKTAPIKTFLQIDELNVNNDDLFHLMEKFNLSDINDFSYLSYRNFDLNVQVMEEMEKLEVVSSEHYQIDFSQAVTPFYDNFLFTDEEYLLHTYADKEDFEHELWGTINYYSQESSYYLSPVNYRLNGEKISIKLAGTEPISGVPVYRTLEKVSHYTRDESGIEVIEGQGIYFNHVGDFELNEDDEVLAASPLGIYGIHEAYLSSDKNKQLQPTAVPGSFISTPAHGMISIDWAEQLKGNAPIDAIRVKVAGIDGYDEASAAKIRDIAQEFSDQGFTVDIVAGASYQWLEIDVEGIGQVVQPWTTLGAADTLIESWDLVKIVLVLLFSAVSLVYFLFSCINIMTERKASEEQLRHFGWSEKHIRKLRFKEWGRLFVFPFLPALIFVLGYSFYTSAEGVVFSQFLVLFMMVLLVLGIYSLSRYMQREKMEKSKNGSILVQNTWYHCRWIIAAAIQLFFLAFISIFLTLLLQHEEQRSIQTTLGIYIHGQMESFYIVLLVILYVVAFITVAEALLILWRRREEELKVFYHIGWGRKKIYSFYFKEVLSWSIASVTFGAAAGLISYRLFVGDVAGQLQLVQISLITVLVMTGAITVSLVVFTYILRQSTDYWNWKVNL
nr:hypothetical protein [Evansella caseinilytica]